MMMIGGGDFLSSCPFKADALKLRGMTVKGPNGAKFCFEWISKEREPKKRKMVEK